MRILQGSGPQKCIRCLRTKDEAIREHLQTMTVCENPECPFREDIMQAIEQERMKPKFTFGSPQKAKMTFGTPVKKTIKFGAPKK